MRTSICTGVAYSRVAVSIEDKLWVLTKCEFQCIFCGMDFRTYPFMFTIEHISHKYRGGSDEVGNLAASCACCNSARGRRTVKQMVKYIEERRGKLGEWNPAKYLDSYKNRNAWLSSFLHRKSTGKGA